jgi:sec-independent protein translocase protein TatB
MGFGEILLVALIAIIFLGPDKLPETMVNIAKFFRQMKRTVSDTKESIESELNIAELKSEALEYKQNIEKNTTNLYADLHNESREVKDIFGDLNDDTPIVETAPEPLPKEEPKMPTSDEIKAAEKAKKEKASNQDVVKNEDKKDA